MKFKTHLTAIAAATTLALLAAGAQAQTVRIANQGDSLSMDPHSLNESLQLSVTGNVYEPLVGRGKDLSLTPALATSWKAVSPTVWRFELRKGVKFHDGKPFTADDVVFSLKRAADDGGDFKGVVGEIKEVRKVSEFVVDVETKAPFPILPDQLSTTYIMSKAWCEENQA
ncbi:MAG: ABC transporter substrate-binding protein, partial [Ramlibacter sp.]|nr:ABC transporter substrate-binding protein [Ramlibacter sp.]